MPRVGQKICNNEIYQIYSHLIFVNIKPIVDITPRAPTEELYTSESVKSDPEQPLRFVADESALTQATEFAGRTLIADGVTPMLLRLEIPADKLERVPEPVTLRAKARVISGELTGAPVQDRTEVFEDGAWSAGGSVVMSKEKRVAHIAIKPFSSDELKFAAGSTELKIQVDVATADLALGSIQISVRRPPIALIHGYNTTGDWGTNFVKALAASRGSENIVVARYGQDEAISETTGSQAAVNTLWSLRDLVPLAEEALDQAVAPLRAGSLFTRFDVVAHSQGGLLTRMLCSDKPSRTLAQPFRNEQNYFRGRFHRVVTVGSPHNGTRLLRYLLTLSENEDNSLPAWVGYGMVEANIAQAKFDPWGWEIRQLNDPRPEAIWAPDPAAKFHLVRTVVMGGRAVATSFDDCPAMWALGLDNPAIAETVAPLGSDGVVDFESMLATTGSIVPPDGYSVANGNRISHAYYEITNGREAFGATSGQALSPIVGQHVISALDQSDTIPVSERGFGPFQVPALLADATRDAIDGAARSFDSDSAPADLVPVAQLNGGFQLTSVTRDFAFRFTPPVDLPVSNAITWIPYVFSTNGYSPKGVQIRPPGTNHPTVRVSAGVYGDVILEGLYQSTGGKRVFIRPFLIASIQPPGVTAQTNVVVPGDGARHPLGVQVPVELWTKWSDGRKTRRYLSDTNFNVASSAPSILDVSKPLLWKAKAVGDATLTVVFEGRTNVVQWQVFDPEQTGSSAIRLMVQTSPTGGVTFSWPANGSEGYKLQSADQISGNWQDVEAIPSEAQNRLTVNSPITGASRFFRLIRPTARSH